MGRRSANFAFVYNLVNFLIVRIYPGIFDSPVCQQELLTQLLHMPAGFKVIIVPLQDMVQV